ncbi:hypothetical protein I3842_Q143300 [Carya illinoinensis]|uniref:Uncharacterized protein n=1 Tax=Carya illinoinensis TaxID=32201 RepID=A0A921ZX55_CARIL|nr:hypothetical protein I3842_Q143300 [Carya illinoinensis]
MTSHRSHSRSCNQTSRSITCPAFSISPHGGPNSNAHTSLYENKYQAGNTILPLHLQATTPKIHTGIKVKRRLTHALHQTFHLAIAERAFFFPFLDTQLLLVGSYIG